MSKLCASEGCDDVLKYDERFDAHFCARCDEWKTPRCSDVTLRPCDVGICTNRPEKPSMVEAVIAAEMGQIVAPRSRKESP